MSLKLRSPSDRRWAVATGFAACALALAMPSAAVANDQPCLGPQLGGVYDNVVVPPGAECELANALVLGNVKALEDSRLRVVNTEVRGGVHGDKAEAVSVTEGTVGGDVNASEGETPGDAAFDFELSSRVGGNVKVEEMAGNVSVVGSQIGGGLIVLDNPIPEALTIDGNSVAGNVQVFKNFGPGIKSVSANNVGADLQCQENDPPFLGQGNIVRGNAEGQCAQPRLPTP
jgi:hypothetical protein